MRTKKQLISFAKDKNMTRKFNKSIQKINGINCSPSLSKNKTYSCYSQQSLQSLKKRWNRKNKHLQIKTNNPQQIHQQLKQYLRSSCGENELCWLKQKDMFDNDMSAYKSLKTEFAPFSPKVWRTNRNEWLYDTDIANVMRSYERAYKCFAFVGPTSIDFDRYLSQEQSCVSNDLCKFSLSSYIKKKKQKIGIIFNTDTYEGSGKHWISLFIHLRKKTITYFDSGGKAMPREINALVQRIIQQGKKLNIYLSLSPAITTQHQLKDSECGVYSLFFIINMLEDNIDSYFLNNNIIRDEDIEEFRSIYFNMPI